MNNLPGKELKPPIAKNNEKEQIKNDAPGVGDMVGLNELKIKESVSDRVRQVFLKDTDDKISILKSILDSGAFEKRKEEIKIIAHGYKGNAGYMGLKSLETEARELDGAFKTNESDNRIIDLAWRMTNTLEKIITENAKPQR